MKMFIEIHLCPGLSYSFMPWTKPSGHDVESVRQHLVPGLLEISASVHVCGLHSANWPLS
jgi:hypothetical protein